jgi:hypothetical protein
VPTSEKLPYALVNHGRINMKVNLLVVATLACAYAASASAEVRDFAFTGIVNESTPMAPAGSAVTGTFSYDRAARAVLASGVPAGTQFGFAMYANPYPFTLRVNGHTVTASVTYVDVANNGGGNVEDYLNIRGVPPTLDGTYFAEGNVGFFLATGPGNTSVLRTVRPPRDIQVAQYDGMNYGWVMVDGSSNGTVVSFIVTSVVSLGGESAEDD